MATKLNDQLPGKRVAINARGQTIRVPRPDTKEVTDDRPGKKGTRN